MEKKERRQITEASDHSNIARMMKIPSLTGKFPEIEELLLKWFKQVQTTNVPVDGTVFRSKAAELTYVVGINDFKASNGWINKFRQRPGLVYRSVRGEAAGVNIYTVDIWKDRLQVLLNDCRLDDASLLTRCRTKLLLLKVKIAVAANLAKKGSLSYCVAMKMKMQ
ncbi:Tigger transposable element-derived protein 4 [Trichinella pseudospiralis]|uniref:Tigger transposable element-derived protein 4 n=1 Tax=Trichinella pseudospiralis TaxID=6337 RepID=A0A0V0YF00_TRIPS|nr:Tigger transposable element-derived protein 4 [Trichinella pseudospiralis]